MGTVLHRNSMAIHRSLSCWHIKEVLSQNGKQRQTRLIDGSRTEYVAKLSISIALTSLGEGENWGDGGCSRSKIKKMVSSWGRAVYSRCGVGALVVLGQIALSSLIDWLIDIFRQDCREASTCLSGPRSCVCLCACFLCEREKEKGA